VTRHKKGLNRPHKYLSDKIGKTRTGVDVWDEENGIGYIENKLSLLKESVGQ
jgi:hypothetical protein